MFQRLSEDFQKFRKKLERHTYDFPKFKEKLYRYVHHYFFPKFQEILNHVAFVMITRIK